MRRQWRSVRGVIAVAAAGALAASGCAPGGGSGGNGGGGALDGVELQVAAKWTGVEQENFEKVLDAFEKDTGAKVSYESTGEDTGAYLGPKIEAGEAPDVAILPQPGLLAEYAGKDALVPLEGDAAKALDDNYSDYWKELGSVEGEPYGILIKAAHKSIVWYRPDAFDEAGVEAPATWKDLTGEVSGTLSDAGITPFAMCGASGWTLTDWFENVYLSQAGPEKYDQLVAHEIKWTDPSVVKALETLADVWGEKTMMAGGAKGAVQTDFPTCVTQVYGQQKAAMVMEADFVAASVAEAGSTVGEDALTFPFPAVGDDAPVVVGGDIAAGMSEKKGTQELLAYLASPEAGTTWAGLGGYLSANSEVEAGAYADKTTKDLAQTILDAGDNVRYDLSDQVPSAFGGTEGKGMWAALQDYLRDPGDAKGTAEALEKSAAAADS